MKCYSLTGKIIINSATIAFVAALIISAACQSESAESPASTMTNGEHLHLGERMYREGILPSEEPMQAYVKGDIPAPGTAFSCVSCHMNSGLGSVEGGVYTPPPMGKISFSPVTCPGQATTAATPV